MSFNSEIQRLITAQKLSVSQAQHLTQNQINALSSASVQDLFMKNELTIEAILQPNFHWGYYQIIALEDPFIKNLLAKGYLNFNHLFQQNFQWDYRKKLILEDTSIQAQLAAKDLNYEQILSRNFVYSTLMKYLPSMEDNNMTQYNPFMMLENPIIKALLEEGKLTFEQLFQRDSPFSESQKKALAHEGIQWMLKAGYLNFEQLLARDFYFGEAQMSAISRHLTFNMIKYNCLTIKELFALKFIYSDAFKKIDKEIDETHRYDRLYDYKSFANKNSSWNTLNSSEFQKVAAHHPYVISREKAGQPLFSKTQLEDNSFYFAKAQHRALLDSAMQAMLEKGYFSIEQICNHTFTWSNGQKTSINNSYVQDLIKKGYLTCEQALHPEFIHHQLSLLSDPVICVWLEEGKITSKHLLGHHYKYHLANLFDQEGIHQLIIDANKAYFTQGIILANAFNVHVHRGHLTAHIKIEDKLKLALPGIQNLIQNAKITVNQALRLEKNDLNFLAHDTVNTYIVEGYINPEESLRLTPYAQNRLKVSQLLPLIQAHIMTFEQLLTIHPDHIRALMDEETRQRLVDGELRLDNFWGLEEVNPVLEADQINNGQSTHNASVHRAVSVSAQRLVKRYTNCLEAEGIHNILMRFENFVEKHADENEKNQAAYRALRRIMQDDFVDETSQVSLPELLALVFLAISDQTQIANQAEAQTHLFEGLYEIQRGYNLDEHGKDDGKPDNPICKAGTFNKLIEKLVSLHPDCEICYITHETAALKFPRVVCEELMLYLEAQANGLTAEDYEKFIYLLSEIQAQGMEFIWPRIAIFVEKRMFNEFGLLYVDKNDGAFKDFMASGMYVELPDLTALQKSISKSTGYQPYCHNHLRHANRFFVADKKTYLSDHRHTSYKAQQAYDNQFGLTLRA
ncbi:MAG: hypothetical protein CMF38_03715 [Legionellaceae bacterium]|nr:hypothetical protein [Legionellaceae bacterium]HCA88807.1 hypothetical protein [Legionellales bacterium]|tara:strand:- start:823 stop:3552 length:2730 start_codon:yes stop_codon:yes gene_type:complete